MIAACRQRARAMVLGLGLVAGWGALAEESRQEIVTLFPQLEHGNFNAFGDSARVTLKPHEARMLFAQQGGV